MEETKHPNASTNESAVNEGDATPERDAEATSDETLSDIEASEKVSSGGASESSPFETSTPDPDAGGGGRADGSDTGGPM
jgi:hypothetical protein